MAGPAPFIDMGKKTKDLLTKGYNYFDQKFYFPMLHSTGMGPISTRFKKTKSFLQKKIIVYKSGNTTMDVKVDSYFNVSTKVTVNDVWPCSKTALSLIIPNHKSGKLDVQYLHPHVSIDPSIGLNPTPLLEISATIRSNKLPLGGEVRLDTTYVSSPKYTVGICLNKPDFIAFLLTDKEQAPKASYIHFVNPFIYVAAEMTLRFFTYENNFSIRSSHDADPFTVVKTWFSENRKVAMLCQCCVNSPMELWAPTPGNTPQLSNFF
ncbi:hypothetical protein REPUB_Repub06bG0099100 [Reevesia pubescens]